MIRTGELTERVLAHYGCAGDTYRGMQQRYVGMTQLRADSGWDVTTADVVIVGAWGSTNHEIEGFEVKISRSDWLNEVKKPNKNDAIKQYCDRFWLVIADESMVKDGELPEDWGMMVVSGTGLKVVKKAPKLEPVPVTHGFLAMMMRSNQSNSIPMDVHTDSVKDAYRSAEAQYKTQSEGLLQFVKELDRELGIKIDYDKLNKKWRANISNWDVSREVADGGNLNPAQLAAAVRIALSGDMKTLKWRMESIANSAEDLLKIAKDFA